MSYRAVMQDKATGNTEDEAAALAVAKAYAVYTPGMLRVYDQLVHGVSNRFAWKCPTRHLIGLYREELSPRHLEAGVGTGFFIDRAAPSGFERLVIADINRNCLQRSARRLARYSPVVRECNLLSPLDLDIEPVDSVGLTYVLHCLPGSMEEKLVAIDHLRPWMRDGATLFGATILGRGIEPNALARFLLGLYNDKGIFNNREDDLETLAAGLRSRFADVALERHGRVATFRARF